MLDFVIVFHQIFLNNTTCLQFEWKISVWACDSNYSWFCIPHVSDCIIWISLLILEDDSDVTISNCYGA
jgi:hypothetical protein